MSSLVELMYHSLHEQNLALMREINTLTAKCADLYSKVQVAGIKHHQQARRIIQLEGELIDVKRRYHRCRKLLRKNAD